MNTLFSRIGLIATVRTDMYYAQETCLCFKIEDHLKPSINKKCHVHMNAWARVI